MALLRPSPDAAPPEGATAAPRLAPLRPMPRHPEPLEVRAMLAELLDKPVVVTIKSDRPGSVIDDAYLVATYVSAEGGLEVFSSADVAFAAAAGASLALIPPGRAEEWVAERQLTDEAADNAAEVLNILAAALNDVNTTRHVKMIDRWVSGGEGDAPDPEQLLGGPRRHIVYTVDIEGYPLGELAFASR